MGFGEVFTNEDFLLYIYIYMVPYIHIQRKLGPEIEQVTPKY